MFPQILKDCWHIWDPYSSSGYRVSKFIPKLGPHVLPECLILQDFDSCRGHDLSETNGSVEPGISPCCALEVRMMRPSIYIVYGNGKSWV